MSVKAQTELGEILLRCAQEEGGVRRLAHRIGLSHQCVYDVIQGAHDPSRLVKRAISDFLSGRRREEVTVSPETVGAWARTERKAAASDGPMASAIRPALSDGSMPGAPLSIAQACARSTRFGTAAEGRRNEPSSKAATRR